jgi:hypothetical protein
MRVLRAAQMIEPSAVGRKKAGVPFGVDRSRANRSC